MDEDEPLEDDEDEEEAPPGRFRQWFERNRKRLATLALAVPQYIAGFALFHYAPPKPDRILLHLFFQILEADFFRELGFDIPYVEAGGRLNKQAILKAIKKVVEQNRQQFPYLRPDVTQLDFASPVLFAKSFLLMIKDLNLSRDQ